jgi:transposase-like protein
MNKIGLQIPEAELQDISGGFNDSTYKGDVICPVCGASARKDFSKQIWRSLLAEGRVFYRCKKCNQYFSINGVRSISELGNEEEFKKYLERNWGF